MSGSDEDALSQIARLRAQLETLMREKLAPAAETITERLEAAAHDPAGTWRAGSEELTNAVRAQPLTALLIAAAVGFILGRMVR